MALLCGIDEAGRGPVIGPLVMAGVVIDAADEQKLQKIGVKDSKMLTPKQREQLYDQIIEIVSEYKIMLIDPKDVDFALTHPIMNLNRLEAVKSADIINELKPTKAFIDCPSNNIKMHLLYLKKFLSDPAVELVLEHKADVNYPVCAAASILAKVARDAEIDRIKKEIGIDFGSGYQSDPATQEFIQKHWKEYPHIMRKTWETYKELVRKSEQKSLGEY